MFKTLVNAFKTPEIRKKLFYTLLLLVIFRIGCFITIPMVNLDAVSQLGETSSSGITGLINIMLDLEEYWEDDIETSILKRLKILNRH